MKALPDPVRRHLLSAAVLALAAPGAARAVPAISVEGVTFAGEAFIGECPVDPELKEGLLGGPVA
jgi:hypothetical protein